MSLIIQRDDLPDTPDWAPEKREAISFTVPIVNGRAPTLPATTRRTRRPMSNDDQAPDLEPYNPTEIIAALHTANQAAKRVHGTAYYQRAHDYINSLLDQLVGR